MNSNEVLTMGGFKIEESRFGIKNKNKKRNICKYCKYIILYIIFLIITFTIAVAVVNFINCSLNNLQVKDSLTSTWLGSVASYWGGVIGGIISGTFTVIGVILTIRYYRQSDSKKERICHMPFISAEIIEKKHISTEKIDLSKAILVTNPNTKENDKGTNQMLFRIVFENIGAGFAHTLTINTGETLGGTEFSKLIKISTEKSNNSVEIEIKAYCKEINSHDASFALRYIDCMTNEYIQSYSIHRSYSIQNRKYNYSIHSGYPTFIGQAHDIGND